MNTPLNALTAAGLSLLLGGVANAQAIPLPTPKPSNYNQGTTADGKTIVAAGTYGPFQGPTCEAGSPGCTAAGADLAPTEGSLVTSGEAQTKAVQASEDAMLKNGTYKAMTRTPDGKSAIITLPDGSITISNYEKGYNTMPRKPEDILKDPNTPPEIISAVKKNQMSTDKGFAALAAPSQNPDKGAHGPSGSINAPAHSNANGSDTGATDPGSHGVASGPSPATSGPGNGPSSDANPTDYSGMGGQMAANGLGRSGSVGTGGGAPTAAARDSSRREMTDMTAKAVSSADNGREAAASYTYTRLADCASGQNCPTLNVLRKTKAQVSNGAAAAAAAAPQDDTTRGTNFFGR